MKKNINDIYEMLARYEDATLIYSYTPKGSREYQHIETLRAIIDAIDIEEADKTDDMSGIEKYNALEAAWQALYREYEIKAQNYVKEVVDSVGFKDYIAENGYAY